MCFGRLVCKQMPCGPPALYVNGTQIEIRANPCFIPCGSFSKEQLLEKISELSQKLSDEKSQAAALYAIETISRSLRVIPPRNLFKKPTPKELYGTCYDRVMQDLPEPVRDHWDINSEKRQIVLDKMQTLAQLNEMGYDIGIGYFYF